MSGEVPGIAEQVNKPVKLLCEVGGVEFWLYTALPRSAIEGPSVIGEEGHRVGQLIVKVAGLHGRDGKLNSDE